MNAWSIITIGGLALVFLSYFSGGFCMADQPNGGALCFKGWQALGTGGGPSGTVQGTGGVPTVAKQGGGGNCQFAANQVCWLGANGGRGCISANSKSSDFQSASGRKTLCARARKAYLQRQVGGPDTNKYLSPITRTAHSEVALSYPAQQVSLA